MSLINVSIDGNSVMEQNIRGIAEAYVTLDLTTKVLEDGKTPTWLFGRNQLHNNIGPPRVTWVPDSGTFVGPYPGGGLADGDTVQRDVSIVDRMLTMQVYCNGETYEQAENLMSSVIAATRQALGPDTQFTDETWLSEQDATSDNALNQHEVVLSVAMRMPSLMEQGGLTTILAETHTEIIDPDLVTP